VILDVSVKNYQIALASAPVPISSLYITIIIENGVTTILDICSLEYWVAYASWILVHCKKYLIDAKLKLTIGKNYANHKALTAFFYFST